MVKLKKIKLLNYCGYREVEFDLKDDLSVLHDCIRKWFMVYGPNGYGKSNILNAVRLLSSPWEIESKMSLGTDPNDLGTSNNATFFRRFTYNTDYQPGYEAFAKKTNLYMEGVFQTDDGDKRVVIENNYDKTFCGVSVNELPKNVKSASFFVDADNPINYQKFQIPQDFAQPFLDFASSVYNFNCELPDDQLIPVKIGTERVMFYTDFIIHKFGTKVHYKRMSAGEKKIATLLATLFNTSYENTSDNNSILLIDNIELHIYFKRHMKLIEKMNEYFPKHQIIATTHSPIIINEMDKKYLVDLEDYVKYE